MEVEILFTQTGPHKSNWSLYRFKWRLIQTKSKLIRFIDMQFSSATMTKHFLFPNETSTFSFRIIRVDFDSFFPIRVRHWKILTIRHSLTHSLAHSYALTHTTTEQMHISHTIHTVHKIKQMINANNCNSLSNFWM